MDDVRAAVLDRLGELPTEASLFEFGPLVLAGYDQHAVVNVLFKLAEEKVIDLLPDNRLRRLK
jgi:hypothetical protein